MATYDDEGIVDYFLGRSWRGLSAADLRGYSAALTFFDAAAFRYYLPAFMVASLNSSAEADVIPSLIVSSLAGRREDLKAFSPSQREVISKFVEAVADEYDRERGDFSSAMENLAGHDR